MTAGFGSTGGMQILGQDALATAGAFGAGDIVNAQVVEDLGEGRYTLQIGQATLDVKSETPLEPGQTLSVRVSSSGGTLTLEVVSSSGENAAASGGVEAATLSLAAQGDEAVLSSSSRVSVPVRDLVAGLTGTTNAYETAVGLTVRDGEAVLHFPNGTMAEAVLLSEGSEGVASQTAAPVLPVGVDAGVVSGAALPTESATSAALLLQEISLDVFLTAGTGERVPVSFSLPLADAIPFLNALSGGADGVAVSGYVVETGAEGVLALRFGDLQLTVPEAELPALGVGDAVDAVLSERAVLDGVVRVASGAVAVDTAALAERLHALGLASTSNLRMAAEALLQENVPLTREAVQALVSLAAGQPEGERAGVFQAGARLLAQDIPLAPALADGVRSIADAVPVHEALQQTRDMVQQALAALPETALPETRTAMEAALAVLRSLPVPVGDATTATALQSFLNDFGREAFAQVVQNIETAASGHMGQIPSLQSVDEAVNTLLPLLQEALAAEAAGVGASGLPSAETGLAGILPSLFAEGVLQHDGTHPGVDALQQVLRDLIPVGANPSEEVAAAVRQWLSPEGRAAMPEALARLAQEPPERVNEFLRALQEVERDVLRRDPVVSRLADAAESMRDVGRRFVAYKAEGLAGMRQDPSTFAAEVPIRWNNEENSGRLKMFYRRGGRGEGKRWSARIVLDLQTTNMGPVVGDMQFYPQQVRLKLFSQSDAMADFMARDAAELSTALKTKGFGSDIEFLVIPVAEENPAGSTAERADLPQTLPRSGLDIEA